MLMYNATGSADVEGIIRFGAGNLLTSSQAAPEATLCLALHDAILQMNFEL